MKIFEKLLDKLFEKIANKISENHSKWFFEKVGDVLIVQIPLPNLPPQKERQYLNYAENMFRKYLKEFGVKEIITVENRVSR
jgi:hypothetical protein